MRSKIDGQNLLFIVMLALIVMLSYCSIPHGEKDVDPWEQAKMEHLKETAVSHKTAPEAAAHKNEQVAEETAGHAEESKETTASHGEAEEEVVAETHAEKEMPAETVASETHAEADAEPSHAVADAHGEKAVVPAADAAEETETAHAAEPGPAPEKAVASSGAVAAVMAMDNPEYAAHKKPIVVFTHQKHAEEYKISCGQCHHDDAGEPLADLAVGDDVEGCIACHSEPGKAPAKVDGKKLTNEDKLAYHTDALHQNCITCHKAYNKENNTKAAPASCNKCHDKDKAMPAVMPAAAAEPVAKAEKKVVADAAEAAPEAAAAPAETDTAVSHAAPEAAAPVKAAAETPAEASTEKPAATAPAAVAVAAVMAMDNPEYAAHKKPIVVFTHQKHAEDYKIGCGDCHHDDAGEPLADLAVGDDVEGCIACHSEPGKAPAKVDGKKLTNEDKLAYHTDALHQNCITCHKAYNKENNTKAAPASCNKCHDKTKSMPVTAEPAAEAAPALEAEAAPAAEAEAAPAAEAEAAPAAEAEAAPAAEAEAAPAVEAEAAPAAEAEAAPAAEAETAPAAEAEAAPAAEVEAAPAAEAETAPAGAAEIADVIAMDNPAYKAHKKGIVQFTHKKHLADYGITCGECHHDDQGAPLADLKMGDAVESCLACHDEPSKAPAKVDGKKLSKEDKLAYHADALHQNCITCHKAFNKENNTKAAPASCNKCHPKN